VNEGLIDCGAPGAYGTVGDGYRVTALLTTVAHAGGTQEIFIVRVPELLSPLVALQVSDEVLTPNWLTKVVPVVKTIFCSQ
jgi:hypothetical protein